MKASISILALLLVAATADAQEIRKALPVLPPGSVELEPWATPIPSHPWALPAQDDPFYDGVNEFIIQQEEGYAPYVRVYRRGVFVGYGELEADPEAGPEPYEPLPGDLVAWQRRAIAKLPKI
jgi:hypothetical protein